MREGRDAEAPGGSGAPRDAGERSRGRGRLGRTGQGTRRRSARGEGTRSKTAKPRSCATPPGEARAGQGPLSRAGVGGSVPGAGARREPRPGPGTAPVLTGRRRRPGAEQLGQVPVPVLPRGGDGPGRAAGGGGDVDGNGDGDGTREQTAAAAALRDGPVRSVPGEKPAPSGLKASPSSGANPRGDGGVPGTG